MYKIVIYDAGPLYVRLKYDKQKEAVRVACWDPTPHGGPGPIEVQGVVRPGDTLFSINDKSLAGVGFKACIAAIKQASHPRTLLFSSTTQESKRAFTCRRLTDADRKQSSRGWCLKDTLSAACIDDAALRMMASSGLTDTSSAGAYRPLAWRLLLQCLPTEKNRWSSQATSQRDLYQQFLKEFTPDLSSHFTIDRRQSCKSMWTQLQQDSDLKDEIHKDVIRTHLNIEVSNMSHADQDAMKRILFIYAKLNPGVRYVQGMNEILGTLFHVLASDPDQGWASFAEADTFFCFTNLMSEIRDVFIHSLDNSESGLRGKIARVNEILQDHDPELWQHLNASQLNPAYYSLRWITTLLAREFSLADTVRLWDAIFAEHMRVEFLCYFCASMLLAQRSSLLCGDFTCCLRLLQNYPPCDPEILLKQATTLRRLDYKGKELGTPSSESVLSHLRLTGTTGIVAWFGAATGLQED